ncbi:hypothetical protein [Antarctobacter sp.]|uniref:hypothetical protein n=1 Tax=Antarctobacter sp. TaxID=1872577 RepID=UPI002B26E743|nr:hypothetical protein [Antarctobacter sp.]
MTTQDPYLRQHEARYAPDERIDQRLATTRGSKGSVFGLVVAVAIGLAIVAVLSLGPAATTDPVEAPVAVDPTGAPMPMTDAPDAPVAPDGAPVE